MRTRIKILLFPGGTENALEIIRSLRSEKEIQLFSTSSDVINHAPFIFCKNYTLPNISDPNWLKALNSLIKNLGVDYIYPANSLIIDALCACRDQVLAPLLLPDNQVIQLTRSKKATIKALKDHIPCPDIFSEPKLIKQYPVFIKPDQGYGSQGAQLIRSQVELQQVKSLSSYIIQEHLSGKEYTVDCFSDRHGKLRFSAGRERIRIRMGTSMHAKIVQEDLGNKINQYAQLIQNTLKIQGACSFS